ncbi:MAG: methyl-accepting chemotaxis protein [Anaerotruncus sp.]|nr:methyl-accepting chemotaxis protein [Anaerotruncus sp.]
MDLLEKQTNFGTHRKIRRSLSSKILRNTTFNILVVVIICCIIMALSMQSLANNILLDSLQPMARQSAKTMEANIHMLADRMMTIALNPRMFAISGEEDAAAIQKNRATVLTEAAEIYEFYTLALYGLDGRLVQGIDGAPESLEQDFFSLLQETDNLTTDSSTIFQGKLGVTMGMPVKQNGETILYVVGIYKYDTLNDVISNINIGNHGMAYMVNRSGTVTGHPDQSVILAESTMLELSDGSEEALSHMTTGETGATEIPIDGDQMLLAFSPIRGTQWSLVVQVPKSDYNHFINAAMMIAVLFTVVVLILSILLVLRLSRSISRPVKVVTNRMVALSDGDLHTEVLPVRSGDEIELLTQTLEDTLGSVNRYISDIQQVLNQVANGNLCVAPQVDYKGDFALIRRSLNTIIQSINETIVGFRSAATRLADMSEELNGQSVQLHQASLEQNQSTEALVLEVSHVKEQLANVTENSEQTRAKTAEITQCIHEANAQMSALSGAMHNISTNTKEITKIAKAIEDIAFQTSILSINASVEAARAGEAGKGFSVVAAEVQQLAAKSSEAAKNATTVVANTQAIIQNGVELTADTADSFQTISTISTQISEISDQLATAIQGQNSALAIIEERIDMISAIADQNLQNAGGTEQSSGLLAKEAEVLQQQVKKFVLKEEIRL